MHYHLTEKLSTQNKYSNEAIKDRFLQAFDMVCAERSETAKELAPQIGTTAKYISTLRKLQKSYVRPDIFSTLCHKFKILLRLKSFND